MRLALHAEEWGEIRMAQLYRRPSPAVAFVGRHNSGKTTLIEKVIAYLAAQGLDVGSVKHHGHRGFDIDYPGKDSYRHRAAGSRDVVIVAPDLMARVTELDTEPECDQVVADMPGHDIVIVEGYRQSGLDTIEVMRSANERDAAAMEEFIECGTVRGGAPVAVATDDERTADAAFARGIAAFGLEDVEGIASFLQQRYVRPKVTVAIQAGGESRRMGRSKATVPFLERPLLERIATRLAPVADELLITTNEPQNLTFLDNLDLGCPVRLVTDVYDVRGALRGICTAFSAAKYPYLALVACDMVFASPALVYEQARIAQREGADAVVPCNANGYEPFHGLYRVDACLPAVEEALARGDSRAKDFFGDIAMREFTRDEVKDAAPFGGCFVNVNTPEELAHAEEMILENGDR